MRDSIPTSCSCNPQVLHRSDQVFIRDPGSGHTFPASRRQVAGRFSELFTECVERESGCWITFDDDTRADLARVASNRGRYEALGLVESDEFGHPLYVVFDHARGKAIWAVFVSYEDAVSHIDGIDKDQSAWPVTIHEDGTYSIAPNAGSLGTAAVMILDAQGRRGRKPVVQGLPKLVPITEPVRKLDLSLWRPLASGCQGRAV